MCWAEKILNLLVVMSIASWISRYYFCAVLCCDCFSLEINFIDCLDYSTSIGGSIWLAVLCCVFKKKKIQSFTSARKKKIGLKNLCYKRLLIFGKTLCEIKKCVSRGPSRRGPSVDSTRICRCKPKLHWVHRLHPALKQVSCLCQKSTGSLFLRSTDSVRQKKKVTHEIYFI